jgi:hypothetical protein
VTGERDQSLESIFTEVSQAAQEVQGHFALRPNRDKEEVMPQILVVTDVHEDAGDTVVYRERVNLGDLESDHFSGQLVERVGWAVLDADELERRDTPQD